MCPFEHIVLSSARPSRQLAVNELTQLGLAHPGVSTQPIIPAARDVLSLLHTRARAVLAQPSVILAGVVPG